MTQEELDSLLLEWQKRLRLQDWDVQVRISRRDSIGRDRQGECEWNVAKRIAKVRILDPIDYPDTAIELQDIEVVLVHELLHCHFALVHNTMKDSDWRDTIMEQAIDSIAKALVNAKRGNSHFVEVGIAEEKVNASH